MSIPTWEDYEKKINHPATFSEYLQYIRTNFKDQIDELDNSEGY